MSAKPKVYQGVRVKITVKEMLQQRRALQAEKNASDLQENRMQFSESFPSCAGIYSGSEPIPSAPIYQQTRQQQNYPSHVESLSFVDQLFLDAYLQPDPLPETTHNFLQIPPLCSPEDNIQPTPVFSQSMTPESPSDGSDFSNSFEYSPTHQVINFAPQSYSSPSHHELRSCAYADVDPYYQQPTSFCYCAYCCSVKPYEPVKVQDPRPHPGSDCMEYFPSSTVTEDFFGRELNNFDMCYI
ncbi:POU class 2 homeobox associating factor 3 [Discoglossus pictus]